MEKNHTTTDKPISEGTSGNLLVQPMLIAELTYNRLPGLSGQVLNVSEDGDPTTTLASVSLLTV